jgi:predicted Zn-dependent protease
MMQKTIRLLMLVCAALLIHRTADARISVEDEKKIGARAAADIDRKEKATTQGEYARKVIEIGERLARAANNKDFQFSFKVIDKKEVNAFALPGGYVYVYEGLKKAAETDDQLAAVLAHEIIHVTNHHWARQYEKARKRNLLLALGVIIAGGSDTARIVAGLVDFTEGNKYSRRDESNADYDGMELLMKAGFDPQGMVGMLQNLGKVAGDAPKLLRWTSDHPSIKNRVADAQKHAAEIERRPGSSSRGS